VKIQFTSSNQKTWQAALNNTKRNIELPLHNLSKSPGSKTKLVHRPGIGKKKKKRSAWTSSRCKGSSSRRDAVGLRSSFASQKLKPRSRSESRRSSPVDLPSIKKTLCALSHSDCWYQEVAFCSLCVESDTFKTFERISQSNLVGIRATNCGSELGAFLTSI
jgi:hypothetical protein